MIKLILGDVKVAVSNAFSRESDKDARVSLALKLAKRKLEVPPPALNLYINIF